MDHLPETSPGLSTAAIDLVILICTYLKGKDILSLRQTCRYLGEATRERTIWLNAARRASKDNALYEPSFDLAKMTIREMECLSLGVHRFNRLLQLASSKAVNSLAPAIGEPNLQDATYLTPSLAATCVSRVYVSNSLSCPKLTLVRGGRYLFALEDAGKLGIYDLSRLNKAQTGANTYITPCLSIDMGPYALHFSTQLSPDPTALRTIWRFKDSDNTDAYVAEMIDFKLSSDPPTVTRYGRITVPVPWPHANRSMWFLSSGINDEHAILAGRLLTIVNFTTKMFAQWTIPVSKLPVQVILGSKEVFVITSSMGDGTQEYTSCVLIYNKPPLTLDSDALLTHQPLDVTPDVILRLPSHLGLYTTCRTVPNGYTGSAEYLWFDLIHASSGFSRVRVRKDSHGQYTLDICPSSAIWPKSLPDSTEFINEVIHEGDEKISMFRFDEYKIICMLSDMFPSSDASDAGSNQSVGDIPSAVLFDWDKESRDPSPDLLMSLMDSFCPVSGRLVVCNEWVPVPGMGNVVGREVILVDYLPIVDSGSGSE